MAHLVFSSQEQQQMRESARSEFPGNPALAYVLESLASEGIDLDKCRDWEDLRLEKGLPPRTEEAPNVVGHWSRTGGCSWADTH
ncbi:hypothetical protein [Streptomyces sp. H27-C3]|uniref:hypothetical protein n=1 Tax=Streptomyces sp. H27-C3 TaxID=3046305 RepID=UPI0024B9D1D7|nr:hypothetical protein [Streptomyces sp. H27-C3]MDJ0465044.1 hypothetical protein [Streptomyces sp. H27-C3]